MGKFAVKIERVITIALILSMMLILIPGVSVQAKAGCNHKHTGRTWGRMDGSQNQVSAAID